MARPLEYPFFRSLCDRLASLRLINITNEGTDFIKNYALCRKQKQGSNSNWYTLLKIALPVVPKKKPQSFKFYLCEPDMSAKSTQKKLLKAIDLSFEQLTTQAGYYDLPAVRDFVCENLKISEMAFDEGVNYLLDLQPPVLTVGLQYEGISARRKPLIRQRESTQIYNIIRRIS